MLLRLTHALERALARHRIASFPPLSDGDGVTVVHLSTPDHLVIFLERMQARGVPLCVQIVTHMEEGHAKREIENRATVPLTFAFEFVKPSELRRARVAVLLTGGDVVINRATERSVRGAFHHLSADTKLIILGDGSLWRGDTLSRLRRAPVRALLDQLRPRAQRRTETLVARRMLPDPIHTWSGATPPRPAPASQRRVLLTVPTRIEQCPATGTAVKPDVIAGNHDEQYELGYHDFEFPAERPDWDALLATYQARRWRNLQRVGVTKPAGDAKRRALDVGCGTGGLAGKLAEEGFKVMAVDVSKWSVELARGFFPDVRFEVSPFEDLSGLEGPFDLITLSHVLEHARDDLGLLHSLKGLLAPGGQLAIEVPWFDVEPIKRRPLWPTQMDHCREYSKTGLWWLVEEAGYTIVAHEDSMEAEGHEPFQVLLAQPA